MVLRHGWVKQHKDIAPLLLGGSALTLPGVFITRPSGHGAPRVPFNFCYFIYSFLRMLRLREKPI
ncbi:hypothetical protein [Polaromonas sp. CG9_12]|nr:hypothetical protein [Polaromonas sp. CG9_12]